jgi:hypothetical protein
MEKIINIDMAKLQPSNPHDISVIIVTSNDIMMTSHDISIRIYSRFCQGLDGCNLAKQMITFQPQISSEIRKS